MTDDDKQSPPSLSSQASPPQPGSSVALDTRLYEALTRALTGVEYELRTQREALATYERLARGRDEVTQGAIRAHRVETGRQAGDVSALRKHVSEILTLVRLGTTVDSTGARLEREQLEQAAQSIKRAAAAVEEHTGQHPLVRVEEPEDGPAPAVVTRAASRLAVRFAHWAWPRWPLVFRGARHALAFLGAFALADLSFVVRIARDLIDLIRAW